MRYEPLVVVTFLGLLSCRSPTPTPSPAAGQTAPSPSVGSETKLASDPGATKQEEASRDPHCVRHNGRLARDCPPEFGEDAWGVVGLSVTNILAQSSIEARDCFRSISPEGSASFIPPLSAVCREGPQRKCVLVPTREDIHEPWEFALPTAEEDRAWHTIHVEDQYSWDRTASTHIRFNWSNKDGRCEVWAEGVADLDGDNFYSTYVSGVEIQDDGEFAPGLTRRELVPENPAKRSETAE